MNEEELIYIVAILAIIFGGLGAAVYMTVPTITNIDSSMRNEYLYQDMTTSCNEQEILDSIVRISCGTIASPTPPNPCDFYANQHSDCFEWEGRKCGNC